MKNYLCYNRHDINQALFVEFVIIIITIIIIIISFFFKNCLVSKCPECSETK